MSKAWEKSYRGFQRAFIYKELLFQATHFTYPILDKQALPMQHINLTVTSITSRLSKTAMKKKKPTSFWPARNSSCFRATKSIFLVVLHVTVHFLKMPTSTTLRKSLLRKIQEDFFFFESPWMFDNHFFSVV